MVCERNMPEFVAEVQEKLESCNPTSMGHSGRRLDDYSAQRNSDTECSVHEV